MMSDKSISAISDFTDWILETAQCPEDLRDQLKLSIEKSLKTHAECLVELVRYQIEAEMKPVQINANISHMDEFLTACFRQRNLELSSKERKDEDTSQDETHIEAIKKISPVLTRDLRITETLVLDNLVQSKALSETGRQSIIKGRNHHSINAAFLKFCNSLSCSEFKGKVLPALKNSNDDVNVKLATDIQAKMDGSSTCQNNYSLCGSCRIRHTVNYRRLADQLYQMKVISDNEREDLSSSCLSNESKWRQLLDIQNPQFIALALKVKCPGLYRLIRLSPENVMTCTCWIVDADSEEDVETDIASDVARISDISSKTNTTSPKKVNNANPSTIFTDKLDNTADDIVAEATARSNIAHVDSVQFCPIKELCLRQRSALSVHMIRLQIFIIITGFCFCILEEVFCFLTDGDRETVDFLTIDWLCARYHDYTNNEFDVMNGQ